MRISDKIARNAKAVAAAIGGLATTVSAVLADAVIDTDEVGTLATAAAVAVGTVYAVWRVPNRSARR